MARTVEFSDYYAEVQRATEFEEQLIEADKANQQLQAEVKRLREALEYYAKGHKRPNDGPWGVNSTDFGRVAKAALEGER